ncbi:MAG: septum formation protein Maf [Candidatus Protochlamydia sp.]|nr:septum formation protein Maf [Candidatus Protochlamydia sp.]
MNFILGSQSPRRKEILNFFTLPFQQVSPLFDEEAIPFQGNPQEYVNILSQGKGESLKDRFPKDVIITADTIVFKDGKIYGKPKDKAQAFQFLKQLAGGWHQVYTGISLIYLEKMVHRVEETAVLFNSLNDEQLHHYQETMHCADKAGGYMIQGAGGLIVNRIVGCYYNVMGLPLNALYEALLEIGVDLWKHLKDRSELP